MYEANESIVLLLARNMFCLLGSGPQKKQQATKKSTTAMNFVQS